MFSGSGSLGDARLPPDFQQKVFNAGGMLLFGLRLLRLRLVKSVTAPRDSRACGLELTYGEGSIGHDLTSGYCTAIDGTSRARLLRHIFPSELSEPVLVLCENLRPAVGDQHHVADGSAGHSFDE